MRDWICLLRGVASSGINLSLVEVINRHQPPKGAADKLAILAPGFPGAEVLRLATVAAESVDLLSAHVGDILDGSGSHGMSSCSAGSG